VFGGVPNATLAYVPPDDVVPAQSPDTQVSDSGDETACERVASTADAALEITTGGPEEAAGADRGEDGADEADETDGVVADPDTPADAVAGLVSDAPAATRTAPDQAFCRLAGLGDTYAERLRAAGVETTFDLRACSVDEVVEVARVPRGWAERWLRPVTPRDEAGEEDVEDAAPEVGAADAEQSEPAASDSG
jgi:predicted flap endonuclease-1-like 5' DNA nuclease